MKNRWTIPPAAVAIHLCAGSVYAWSVFNKEVERLHPQWTPGAAAYTFSIAIVMLGLSAAFGGTWLERHGPRRAATLAALLFGGGLMLGGLTGLTGHYGVGWELWEFVIGHGVVELSVIFIGLPALCARAINGQARARVNSRARLR